MAMLKEFNCYGLPALHQPALARLIVPTPRFGSGRGYVAKSSAERTSEKSVSPVNGF
jgi:hypothetical protein